MTRSASAPYLTSKFDDFLFACVNEESDATPLTVLSILARLDVDPWEEAAKLAALPRGSAVRRLAAYIATAPGAASAYLNAETVFKRLIGLLPSLAGIPTPSKRSRIVYAFMKPRLISWPL